jgi:hypothetical protein
MIRPTANGTPVFWLACRRNRPKDVIDLDMKHSPSVGRDPPIATDMNSRYTHGVVVLRVTFRQP